MPLKYRQIGQPVIIPGDMGRASWVLVGLPGSMEKSFGSTCHGAGRVMSRTAAIQHAQGRRIDRELAGKRRIVAKSRSWKGLTEEQPDAYKDVSQVVQVVARAASPEKSPASGPSAWLRGEGGYTFATTFSASPIPVGLGCGTLARSDPPLICRRIMAFALKSHGGGSRGKGGLGRQPPLLPP